MQALCLGSRGPGVVVQDLLERIRLQLLLIQNRWVASQNDDTDNLPICQATSSSQSLDPRFLAP